MLLSPFWISSGFQPPTGCQYCFTVLLLWALGSGLVTKGMSGSFPSRVSNQNITDTPSKTSHTNASWNSRTAEIILLQIYEQLLGWLPITIAFHPPYFAIKTRLLRLPPCCTIHQSSLANSAMFICLKIALLENSILATVIFVENSSQNNICDGIATNMTVDKNFVTNSDDSKIRLPFVTDLHLRMSVTIYDKFTINLTIAK